MRSSLCRIIFSLVLVCTTLLGGCQGKRPPLTLADPKSLPIFSDSGSRDTLLACAEKHKSYLASQPADRQVTIADRTYPLSWMVISMDTLLTILHETPPGLEIHSRLVEEFDIFQATGRLSGKRYEMLVTGYYEPLFAGSLKRDVHYRYPLYKKPPSLLTGKDPATGKKLVGRSTDDGGFAPFWTRAEIETNSLLTGSELIYLADPVDAFLLHVQGSGRISLPDGSSRAVRFAAHNGHGYKSIGKLLVDEGKLTLHEASIPTIRRYLRNHPEDLQRVLYHNPRYIFFNWGDDQPPPGSLGVPLTPGRSVAIDREVLPDTLFGWLEVRRPLVDRSGDVLTWASAPRFILPQDSGAAIRGAGRVDLFWGSGTYAERAAGNMKETGQLFFFVKKGYKRQQAAITTNISQ